MNRERGETITQQWRSGVTMISLAKEYRLSLTRIAQIIRRTEQAERVALNSGLLGVPANAGVIYGQEYEFYAEDPGTPFVRVAKLPLLHTHRRIRYIKDKHRRLTADIAETNKKASEWQKQKQRRAKEAERMRPPPFQSRPLHYWTRIREMIDTDIIQGIASLDYAITDLRRHKVALEAELMRRRSQSPEQHQDDDDEQHHADAATRSPAVTVGADSRQGTEQEQDQKDDENGTEHIHNLTALP